MMFPVSSNVAMSEENNKHNGTKAYLFDFNKGDFVTCDGKLVECDGIDAIKVWIEKILRTEKGRYSIYASTEYGCHLEDLIIGSSYTIEFIEAELKREIEDALKQNLHISYITGLEITRNTNDITVKLEVVLNDQGRNTISVAV